MKKTFNFLFGIICIAAGVNYIIWPEQATTFFIVCSAVILVITGLKAIIETISVPPDPSHK